MARTSNIFARVEPEIKEQAERVLDQLGIPMSNAVGMFLRQVVLQQGIPFEMKLPKKVPLVYGSLAKEQFDVEVGKGQTQRIMKAIRTLGEMPMRFRLYEEEPWHSAGLRFFSVDNYIVFYLPDEIENTVGIVRIMYGDRDIRRQLSGINSGKNWGGDYGDGNRK